MLQVEKSFLWRNGITTLLTKGHKSWLSGDLSCLANMRQPDTKLLLLNLECGSGEGREGAG